MTTTARTRRRRSFGKVRRPPLRALPGVPTWPPMAAASLPRPSTPARTPRRGWPGSRPTCPGGEWRRPEPVAPGGHVRRLRHRVAGPPASSPPSRQTGTGKLLAGHLLPAFRRPGPGRDHPSHGARLAGSTAGELLPADVDPLEIADELQRRYESLWHELTREEILRPDEQRYRIAERLRQAQRARLRRRGGRAGQHSGRKPLAAEDQGRRIRASSSAALPADRARHGGEPGAQAAQRHR